MMNRETAKGGLRAYRHIGEDIRQKQAFAEETGEKAQYEREAAELQTVKREMVRCLNKLPTLERDCIWRHYVLGEMWVRICRKYAYSERQIRNISNRGLDRLAAELKKSPAAARFCERAKRGFLH